MLCCSCYKWCVVWVVWFVCCCGCVVCFVFVFVFDYGGCGVGDDWCVGYFVVGSFWCCVWLLDWCFYCVGGGDVECEFVGYFVVFLGVGCGGGGDVCC